MPRILVVDSGLRTFSGHNFTYTQAVVAAFRERGCSVQVLVNRGLPAGVARSHGLDPVFSLGAYDTAHGHGWVRDLAYVHAQGIVFAEDLEHAFRTTVAPDPELVLSHTLTDFELLGWNRFLRRRPFGARLAVVLRQTPGFATRSWLRRTVHPYWRLRPRALARLRNILGPRLSLCTDSESLSEDYRSVYPHPVLTLPIPLSDALFATGSEASASITTRYPLLKDTSRLRVGYLGDARAPKGFALLPSAVRAVEAAHLPACFIFQCSVSGGSPPQKTPGLLDLQAIATKSPSDVALIDETLSTGEYCDLARHLDLILLPYLQDHYRAATSGIFAEAMALGTPVVASNDTWMARELQRSGAGVTFRRDHPEEFAPAVTEAVRGHSELKARASAASASWRAFHNPRTLVSLLLGSSPPPGD
jgi:glycosyltransferase involved in cell wall biosynthesis